MCLDRILPANAFEKLKENNNNLNIKDIHNETLDLNINNENLNTEAFYDFAEPFDNTVSKEFMKSLTEMQYLQKDK